MRCVGLGFRSVCAVALTASFYISPGMGLPVVAGEKAGLSQQQETQFLKHTLSRLELARKTLAFVEQSAKQPRLSEELAKLERRISAAQSAGSFPKSLYDETRKLRRRIILAHPLLGFDRLLINKRPPPKFNHQSDQYLGRYSGVGDGLVVLDSWKETPRETVLLAGKLPPGSVLHPDLSFSAARILFSYCDHSPSEPNQRRFFIYEIGIDGGGLRQITGTSNDPLAGAHGRNTVFIEDWDPCYLPDGGMAFVSTRNQGGVRCHFGDRYCPTYTLYRGQLDGRGIRPMAFGEANEWDPSLLHDGRVQMAIAFILVVAALFMLLVSRAAHRWKLREQQQTEVSP